MKKVLLPAFLFLVMAVIGCAKPHVVTDPEASYDSLGTLELKISTDRAIVKYLTLGLFRKHSYQSMTRRLEKKLYKKAKAKYGADAVANLVYWPEPSALAESEFLYGRGEMIRYKKFPPHQTTVAETITESEAPLVASS